MNRRHFQILLLLPLFLLIIVPYPGHAQQHRHPCRFLIPEGYVGWVHIDYQIENAPALPIESGYRVYKIPVSGRLQTSSAVEVGTYEDLMSESKDEYYYYSSETLRPLAAGLNWADGGMIWGHGGGGGGTARGSQSPGAPIEGQELQSFSFSFESFFVGTEEEYGKNK